jgi:catechol 2,3-dioxygenase-like lactoylglutathione lyase family enzyme
MMTRSCATRIASALLFVSMLGASPWALPPAWSAPAPAVASSSAAIRADDVDATVRWYRDRLGFRVIADQTVVQGRSVVLERGGMLLEVAEAADPARSQTATVWTQDPETTGSLAAPVVSLLVDDVDAEVERLRGLGVIVAAEPDDDLEGRFRTAWISDLDKRIVELREPLSGGTGNVP